MARSAALQLLRDAQRASPSARAILAAIPNALPESILRTLNPSTLELLAPHGVLAAIAPSALSSTVLETKSKAMLRQWAALGALRAEQNRRSWTLALDALDRAGVPVVPLKGRSLAIRLYGNPAMRVSGDVDVLVSDSKYEAARDALIAAGFQAPDNVEERFYRREHHHVVLAAPSGMPPIELHFKLSSAIGQAIPADELLARSRVEDVGGKRVRVLSPEDEFVYLCVHAAVQAFTPLQLLVDLKLLAKQTIDWERALQRAREWHVEVSFATALELTRHWTGLAAPAIGDVSWSHRLRARASVAIFADALLLGGVFGKQKRWTAWFTTPALIDESSEAAEKLSQNLIRVAKRSAHRRWPAAVPDDWRG